MLISRIYPLSSFTFYRFGFVEFESHGEAVAAWKGAAGQEVDGRKINVDLSAPRAPREAAAGRAKTFNDERSAPSNVLFLGNLSFSITEDTVWETFGEYGDITSVRLPKDMDSGRPKGFGYVEFGKLEDAQKAIDALTGQEVDGRPIRLDFSTPRSNDGGDRGGRGGGRGGARGGESLRRLKVKGG